MLAVKNSPELYLLRLLFRAGFGIGAPKNKVSVVVEPVRPYN